MIRILTGVKVRHAACGAILRQITASKGSKGKEARRLGRALLISRLVLGPGCQRLRVSERKQKQKTGGPEGGPGHLQHQHTVTTPDTAVSHGPQAGTGSSHVEARSGAARLPNLAYAHSRPPVLAFARNVMQL